MSISNKRTCTSFWFLLCLVFLLQLSPPEARAETHVATSTITGIIRWTKVESPYILDANLTIKGTLLIDPGVVVASASSTPRSLTISGGTTISGTENEPVRFVGLMGIYFNPLSSGDVFYARFESTPLVFDRGNVRITSSKLINSTSTALSAKRSLITIEKSEISGNQTGIESLFFKRPQVVAHGIVDENAIGGIGNALLAVDDPEQNHITVHSSVFERNSVNIKNNVVNIVDATGNWWGSASGPGTSVSGVVSTDPWLLSDPRIKKIECCSNVLFLPGFEASRLYRNDPALGGDTFTTRRSWEPYTGNDVKRLFLGPGGTALGSTTHFVGEVMSNAYGLVGIYAKFFATLSSVVAEKTINAWLPFAYDWRMSPGTVLEGTTYATTTKKLVDEVEKLSLSSKTGKVTVIAHSNGGLLAKVLGRELEKAGKTHLLDKVILVAVPELGTPAAVAGMLHGDGQALLKGFILRAGAARTFGLNLPGAYNLLPSQEYFSRISDPVVTLAGKALNSHAAFTNFLAGKNDKRIQPSDTDLKSPAVLSTDLISKAATLHASIDSWKFASTTSVISLVGWGTPTTKTIEYSTSSPRIRKGPDGDGTVVSASAAGYSGERAGDNIYFNQGLFNHDMKKSFAHANILEADPLRDFVGKILATTSVSSVLSKPLPQYLTQTKPNPNNYSWMSWLTVSVHSPVDMDIYDDKGGHMGLIPVPPDPSSPGSASDVMYFENTIGGQYDIIGDEKYYTLPSAGTYTVQLKGTGTGNFSFQVQKFVGSSMTEVSNTEYVDLPVTPLLVASTTINSLVPAQPLNLDVDGDGKVDIKAPPSKVVNPLLHLEALKCLTRSLHLSQRNELLYIQRIERIAALLARDKGGLISSRMAAIKTRNEQIHLRKTQLTASRQQSLTNDVNFLISNLESAI